MKMSLGDKITAWILALCVAAWLVCGAWLAWGQPAPATEVVKLQWDVSPTATSYAIEVSTNGSTWAAVPTLTQRCYVSVCNATISLPTLQLSLIRVRAANAGGLSPLSFRGVWACPACGPPGPVLMMRAPS